MCFKLYSYLCKLKENFFNLKKHISMATTPEFKYAPMFQTGKDETEYYLYAHFNSSRYGEKNQKLSILKPNWDLLARDKLWKH